MKSMNKDFGFNAIRMASDLEEVKDRIPTGSISLDIDLGGGVPIGRMIQISGGFSACKSALAYHIAANAQKMRKKKVRWEKYCTKDKEVFRWIICDNNDKDGVPLVVAIIQSENHSYSNEWAKGIGVDIDNLIFVTPEGMEEGLEIAGKLQQSGEVDVIIHDSYAAYKPVKVLEKSQEETTQMGQAPKNFDEYHGKYQAYNNRHDREGRIPTTLVALNQLREKIGVYGDPEYEPGGRSIGFTCSINLRLRRGDWITVGTGENKRIIGQATKYKTHKNKTYKQQQTGEFDFYFDEGGTVPPGMIDNAKELIILAIVYEVIERRGGWYYYSGSQLAQGEANVIEKVRNDVKLFAEIKNAVTKLALDVDAEVERLDVFGTDNVTEEDLSLGIEAEEVVVKTAKGRKKKNEVK
jgi:recombination protein RecA